MGFLNETGLARLWTHIMNKLNGKVDTTRMVNGHALTEDIFVTKSDIGLINVDNVKQYSASNPPPYPVSSVNGEVGAVEIDIPVTSVNGQTGDVNINIPVTSVNGQTGDVTVNIPVSSVNGQTGAVSITAASLNAETAGSAANALTEAKSYTDTKTVAISDDTIIAICGAEIYSSEGVEL